MRDHLSRLGATTASASLLLVSAACTGYDVIPSHLEHRIKKGVSIEQVQHQPSAYQGQTVIWGGKILEVSQAGGRLRIEILESPLDSFFRPIEAPTASRGRFLAVDIGQDVKDSSRLQKEAFVTVIGEVLAPVPSAPDTGIYEYPRLAIKDMTAWEKQAGIRHSPPGSQLVGFRPFTFWGGHRVIDSD